MEAYRATIEDLDGIAKLFNSYRMFYKKESNIEEATKYIKERIEKEESVIFVVTNKSEYVGFIQLYPTFSSISMNKSWILNDMFVEENARKLGVGQILLNQVKKFAEESNVKSISLETAPNNYKAQRLYEKNGFEKDMQFLHYSLNL